MSDPLLLTLRVVPKPDLLALDEVQKVQLQYVLSTYAESPEEGVELTDFYAVDDASGAHLYDMHLFCGDDGQVFVRGTTTYLGTFSQGLATCPDTALEAALQDALERHRERANPR